MVVVLHRWLGLAAAEAAAVSSDAPQVSYAKHVVTCVGRDSSGSNILCPFPCFDELAADRSAVQAFKIQASALLCSGTS